jgi:hypothetical protein
MVGSRYYPLVVGKNRCHPTVYIGTDAETWAASDSWNEFSFRESKTGYILWHRIFSRQILARRLEFIFLKPRFLKKRGF